MTRGYLTGWTVTTYVKQIHLTNKQVSFGNLKYELFN